MTPIFDRANETRRPELLEQIQLERLQALLARLRRNVRRYREQLNDAHVETLADLARLPVTRPADLVAAFPYGMFALPLREVVRLHSAVGPDGKQLVVGHTRNDLQQWGRLVARQLVAAGVSTSDVVQICFGGGFFAQALGYMLGAELVGASVIPEDPFHVEYQLELLKNYRATVLITTPTNARELMESLRRRSIDPQSLQLRAVLLSRPLPMAQREELAAGLFAHIFCGFGVAEILDPGLCVECSEKSLHLNEDHFLAETQDGELLVTTLCREAMPLLRYRTAIGARLERRKCACGRTGIVLEPGDRLDERLLVNEMPLYRPQITEFLSGTTLGRQPFTVDVMDRHLRISVEIGEDAFVDEMRVMAGRKAELQSGFLARFGIEAEVRYVAPARTS